MKIQCPHCGVKGSADDSYQGRQVKCPKCSGIFAVTQDLTVAHLGDLPSAAAMEEPVAPEVSPSPGPVDDAENWGGAEDILTDEILTDGFPDGSEEKAEDLADILALEDMEEDETAEQPAGTKPDDTADDVLAWSDIVSEIDEEMAEDARREKEGEGAPAALHDFFSDIPPAAAEAGKPAVELEEVASVEDAMPLAWGISGAQLSAAAPRQKDKEIHGEVEDQPYGLEKEQCWQCGKKDSVGVPFIAKDGRLYCPDCAPPDRPEKGVPESLGAGAKMNGPTESNAFQDNEDYTFSIGGLLREAWAGTQGVKAAIWAGSAVMYLVLLLLGTGGAFLLPAQQVGYDGDAGLGGILSGMLLPFVVNAVSMIFSAGLLLIGIKKVAGENYSWKMVFEGFSVAGKLIVAFILQSLLIFVGFLLLVLPGIYLIIGYLMTIPLIIDRKMSPWQAMETSRKAIHGHWWKVFGLSIVMSLLILVSMIPLGIGLVWTWPMFIVLGGVVYRSLFGIKSRIE